jgi:hypothetical protein
MNRIAAAAVGFAAGVFATSAAVVWAPQILRQETTAAPEDLREPVAEGRALLNADPLGELDVVQRVAMMRWLAAHPQYELVTRDYCGCLDIPEPQCPEPGYVSRSGDYPYTESRDYNRDGHKDIAIMLGVKGKEGPQELLIFNGPFGDAVPEPVFRRTGWGLSDHVYEGFVGPPESDDGYGIQAKGKTYELVYMGNPL